MSDTKPTASSNANRSATNDAAGAGIDTDVAPEDSVAPITYRRTARRGDAQAAAIPAHLARRLIAAYTRAGQTVADVTDRHILHLLTRKTRRGAGGKVT